MSTPTTTKTVLVVDDDGALLALVRETLETSGYRVLTAHNALEAHQISLTFPGRIDLLVADVYMPLMGGVALAEQLRRKRPLRFLFMSGHAGAVAGGGGVRLPPDAAFILKPFTPDAFLGKVRDLLGTTT